MLRGRDVATAHAWFMAIHGSIAALTPQVLVELREVLGPSCRAVQHLGWLAEQVELLVSVVQVEFPTHAPHLKVWLYSPATLFLLRCNLTKEQHILSADSCVSG